MTAIAVVADAPGPVSPCGACRQVMFECGGPDLRVILCNTNGQTQVVRMGDLLPGGFRLEPRTPVQTAAPGKKATARSRGLKPGRD